MKTITEAIQAMSTLHSTPAEIADVCKKHKSLMEEAVADTDAQRLVLQALKTAEVDIDKKTAGAAMDCFLAGIVIGVEMEKSDFSDLIDDTQK